MMGNQLITSSSELAAPGAPGKRDVMDRGKEAVVNHSGVPNVGPGARRSDDEVEKLEGPEERTSPPAVQDDRSDKPEQIREDAGEGGPTAPIIRSGSLWNQEGEKLHRAPDLLSPSSPQDSACGTGPTVSIAPHCPEEL